VDGCRRSGHFVILYIEKIILNQFFIWDPKKNET